jgi:ABC-type transport system substrate-binding protein
MRHFAWQLVAASSLLLIAAQAETRPQYGGTLHIAMHASPASPDPAAATLDSPGQRNLESLIFETLVDVDENGRLVPALATSWQNTQGNSRWVFQLRARVKFHDGTPLTADAAAASLKAANPSWNVSASGDTVVIERESGDADVPQELTQPRNAITKQNADRPLGTGAFHVVDWQPGKRLTLAAEEGYWSGRPFLDGIEVELGKTYREQVMALELGKADLVEVPPEQARRIAPVGRRIEASAPVELLALVFTHDAQTAEEKALREALALSVERGPIRNVLLQGAGEPTASILPNWISGYGFVFSAAADLPRARQIREQVRSAPAWKLGYDGADPLARLLAERIALNAKDAGLSIQPTSAAGADLVLMKVPLASADPWIALNAIAATTGLTMAKSKGTSIEDLYAAEESVLATRRIIPLLHLPVFYAANATVRNWNVRPDASWNLTDAWLGAGKP